VEGKKGSCVCMTMLFFMQIYDFSCLRYIPTLILEKQVVDKLQVRSSAFTNSTSTPNVLDVLNTAITKCFQHKKE
jgi:hypothetical protein